MKAHKLLLATALLFVSLAGASSASTGLASQGEVLPDGNSDGLPDGIVVQPLTLEQQAAIDQGLAGEQTARVRPDSYAPAQHCIGRLEPLSPEQKVSEVFDVRCFDTFSDALAAATGGKVLVPKDFRPDDLTQDILDAATADTVLGVDYWDANFQGSTYTWYTSHTPGCTDGSTYGANLPSSWNDVISSGRGYAGCNNMKHYEHANYGGSLKICGQDWTSCATMGVMNDQTTSVNLRP